MLTYFTVPSSTTQIVDGVNTIVNTWGGGALVDLAYIILGTIFGILVIGYVVRQIHHS